MTDIDRIVARLTKAQRRCVLDARETVGGQLALMPRLDGRTVNRPTIVAVESFKLTTGTWPPNMWLNETGLAVRAHLIEMENPAHDRH